MYIYIIFPRATKGSQGQPRDEVGMQLAEVLKWMYILCIPSTILTAIQNIKLYLRYMDIFIYIFALARVSQSRCLETK